MNFYGKIGEHGSIEHIILISDDATANMPGFEVLPAHINNQNFQNFIKVDGAFLDIGQPPKHPSLPNPNGWVIDRSGVEKQISQTVTARAVIEKEKPVYVDGKYLDADIVSLLNLQSVLLSFQQSKTLPENFNWRDHYNNLHSVTYQDLETFIAVIHARNQAVYEESWAIKDSLSSKSDEELLALYESLTQAASG